LSENSKNHELAKALATALIKKKTRLKQRKFNPRDKLLQLYFINNYTSESSRINICGHIMKVWMLKEDNGWTLYNEVSTHNNTPVIANKRASVDFVITLTSATLHLSCAVLNEMANLIFTAPTYSNSLFNICQVDDNTSDL